MVNPEIHPYVVIGDGIMSDATIVRLLKSSFGRSIKRPVVTFMYAKTIDQAHEIATKMEPWNETVLICKIEEVITQ